MYMNPTVCTSTEAGTTSTVRGTGRVGPPNYLKVEHVKHRTAGLVYLVDMTI